MQKIKVLVGWEEKNYSAVAEVNGVVVVTHKNFETLKEEFAQALTFHIEESIKDGDELPQALKEGD